MSEIKYLEKPDWLSWDAVAECLHEAHQSNVKKNFVMPELEMSSEDLQKRIGNGHCFVALEDGKVLGTSTVIYKKLGKLKWWARGIVAYTGFDGIRPEYRGTDVYFKLQELRMEHIRNSGVEVICFNTSEHNKLVQKINQKRGAKYVQFARAKGSEYYSVVMARWLHGCPYPDWFCSFMFKLSKVIVKTLWKPSRHS